MFAEGDLSEFTSGFGSISTVVRGELVHHVESVMLLFGFCYYFNLGGNVFRAFDEESVWA